MKANERIYMVDDGTTSNVWRWDPGELEIFNPVN